MPPSFDNGNLLRTRVSWSCLAWALVCGALSLVPGLLGASLFHWVALSLVAFSYFLPGPRALIFSLAIAFRHDELGREFFFCQTSVLVLLGFFPALISRAEERRRLEQEIIMA